MTTPPPTSPARPRPRARGRRTALPAQPAPLAHFARLLLLAAALWSSGCAVPRPVVPVVATRQGLLAGAQLRDWIEFRGVRYAAPPVGPLRWRPPAAAPPWEGVRNARANGAACSQPAALARGPTAEDCLWLNVFTPRLGSASRLPVMVWLHGGAFRSGSCTDPVTDGGPLAAQGVVVVTVQYRLGLLGFFAHPELGRGRADPDAEPCNFGLLDQIAALQWVRDNIAGFGGDPANVTLWGQGAGATCALHLLCSEPAQGLFHRAILQSPHAFHEPMSRPVAFALAQRVLADAGLATGKVTAEDLRALPAERLGAVDLPAAAGTAFGPIVDGVVVRRAPHEVFAAGEQAALPLLLGSTDFEGSVLAAMGTDPQAVLDAYGASLPQLRVLYPEAADDRELAARAFGDATFTAGVRWLAARHAERAGAWLYQFRYVPPPLRAAQPGAAHGALVPFAFRTVAQAEGQAAGPTERWLAEIVGQYWTSFAATGTPSARGVEPWPRYTAANDVTLLLDERVTAVRAHLRQRLDLHTAVQLDPGR